MLLLKIIGSLRKDSLKVKSHCRSFSKTKMHANGEAPSDFSLSLSLSVCYCLLEETTSRCFSKIQTDCVCRDVVLLLPMAFSRLIHQNLNRRF